MFATRLKFNPPHQCTDVIDVIHYNARLKFNPHIAFSITLSNTKVLTCNYDSTGSNYTHGDASDAHDYVCR